MEGCKVFLTSYSRRTRQASLVVSFLPVNQRKPDKWLERRRGNPATYSMCCINERVLVCGEMRANLQKRYLKICSAWETLPVRSGFNKLGGCFPPSCLQPAHWAEKGFGRKEGGDELSEGSVRVDSGRIKSDRLLHVYLYFLSAPPGYMCHSHLLCLLIGPFSRQMRGGNCSNPWDTQLNLFRWTAAAACLHLQPLCWQDPFGRWTKTMQNMCFYKTIASEWTCPKCVKLRTRSSCWCVHPAAVQLVAMRSREWYWWAVGLRTLKSRSNQVSL